MEEVSVEEAIEVVAWFRGGELRPLRFRWGERSFRIGTINGQWTERQGDHCRRHYSVQVGEETYFLHLRLPELTWRLDRMFVG